MNVGRMRPSAEIPQRPVRYLHPVPKGEQTASQESQWNRDLLMKFFHFRDRVTV